MSWEEMDTVVASVERIKQNVESEVKKENLTYPKLSETKSVIGKVRESCAKETLRIERRMERVARIQDIQKPNEMRENTNKAAMNEVYGAMEADEDSLQEKKGEVTSLREKTRRGGKELEKKIQEKYKRFAAKFQEKGH